MEMLMLSDKGNWFLYSEGRDASVKNLWCNKAGENITPLSRHDVFAYLESKGRDAEVAEKYFPEHIEKA